MTRPPDQTPTADERDPSAVDPRPGVVEVRPDDEITEVVDGELVTDSPGREPPLLIARRIGGPAARWVVTVLPSRTRARRAVTTTARITWMIGRGGASWGRRAAAGATHGALREQIRAARLAGDGPLVGALTKELRERRESRHELIRELPRTLVGAAAAAGIVGLGVLVILVGLGIVAQAMPGGMDWASWWATLGEIALLFGAIVKVAAVAAFAAALPLTLWAAWREGDRVADPPRWLIAPEQRQDSAAVLTADLITTALMHCKIVRLTRYLKDGGQLDFLVPPREQGGGTYFQVRLPMGVVAAELLTAEKVELLAGNLSRHKHETYPQRDPEADARVLDCWVADKGALDKPSPPWPLLDDGLFDVFRDRAPWGVTMRGEQVAVGLLQKHWLVGATSKQGKTTAVRLLALALALDPTVELRLADLKGDGDWTMFREVAAVLIEGSADEDAEATATMLEELVAEMQRRYDRKRELGIVGNIPRELSRRPGSGFHPIYGIVDECQVLYAAPHPVGGTKDDARAWRAAKRLHDQARAVNIHLWQATQRPDNRTLPVLVREGAHVRAALNVPNVETARLILADASDRGARPQDLRPGRDAGTVVATGEVEDIPEGMAFVIVRTHYVTTAAAYKVVERAVAARSKAHRHLHVVDEPEADGTDHLAVIAEAMGGDDVVRTVELLGRLAERDDSYRQWTTTTLADELRGHGIEKSKSVGQRVVRLVDVRRALDERAR